jgi:hypothetical protein
MKTLKFIQKYFFLALALCLGLTAQAQTIAIEDFDGGTPSWSNDHASLLYVDPSTSNEGLFVQASGSNYLDNGTNVIYGKDLNGETGEPTANNGTITFADIDLSANSGVDLTFDYSLVGFDSSDKITYTVVLDRGLGTENLSFASAILPKSDSGTVTVDIPDTATTAGLELNFVQNGPDYFELDNFKLAVPGAPDPAITLSATPATVDEGSTLAVTLSVPTNVDSDTVFNLTSGGDGTELSIPTTATILAGTNNINFDVSGLSDSEYDIDTAVTITAASTGYVSSSLDITVVDIDTATLTAIRTEDFETDGQDAGSGLTASGDPARYTASSPFNDGSSDHFNRTDGTDISNTSGAYSSFSGTYFWAAEDTDDNGGDGVDEKTLDITGINIVGATDLKFKALFGAGNENGVGASNYDSTDYIKVQAQIDDGGYNEVLWFSFLDPGGSDNDNEPFGVDRDFDGAADSNTDLLGTALQSYIADISGTGSTLDIKIQVHMDIGNEEIAFDNIQILGTVSNDEAITLSATPTTVDEGSTLAVTLSVPTNVSTDTTFVLSSDGNGSELSIPATVTILTGTNSVDFNVSGLGDGTYDNNQTVKITADLAGYISTFLNVSVVDTDSRPPMGDIIFTQYFEGSGNNKWVEITNVGDSSVDLSSYQATLWSNANTETWKTEGGTPDNTLNFTGVTLAAGQSYVIAHPYVSDTHYSYTLSDVQSNIAFFGGNDSLVLYSDPTGYVVGNILDAISFTQSGNEGSNKGFVRASASYGFDFNSGSSIEDYSAVWTQIANTTADTAVDGDDAYAGSTALVAVAADPVADYLTLRSLTSDDLTTDSNGNGFTVLEEYLAGFGDGSGPDAISYGIVNNAFTLTSDLESAPSGIIVVLEATSDLSDAFAPVAFTTSVVDNGDTTYTRSYTETSPPADALQRFLRLSITTD